VVLIGAFGGAGQEPLARANKLFDGDLGGQLAEVEVLDALEVAADAELLQARVCNPCFLLAELGLRTGGVAALGHREGVLVTVGVVVHGVEFEFQLQVGVGLAVVVARVVVADVSVGAGLLGSLVRRVRVGVSVDYVIVHRRVVVYFHVGVLWHVVYLILVAVIYRHVLALQLQVPRVNFAHMIVMYLKVLIAIRC